MHIYLGSPSFAGALGRSRIHDMEETYLVLDEFFPSVDNAVEAFRVANRDVTRLEPSVRRDRILRSLRIIQVALMACVTSSELTEPDQ